MAGGRGTRFWPLSRPWQPKQFLRIGGEEDDD
ncbi:MAG: sugar phosphate nucleotidyltransferase [Candidatus Aminicenantales bacterium]